MRNVYFELTREFNQKGTIAILTSGQAVVYYRTALMSKDGDWILQETPEACSRILDILSGHGARYRPGAPLDVRWLAGGWSSHLQFHDEKERRVRCDFLARPPRIEAEKILELFQRPTEPGKLAVIDLESLIRMKRTQRAKDYPVIAELARLLPEDREIAYTTDPDRILELAGKRGKEINRLPAQEALRGGTREEVVVALAREINIQQEEDRRRLEWYDKNSRNYMERLVRSGFLDRPVKEAHEEIVALAEQWLPQGPPSTDQEE